MVLLLLADIVRLGLLAGVGVAVATGVYEVAFRFAVVFGLTVLTRWLRVPRPFGLAFCVVFAAETWGRFAGLYRAWGPFDEVIHFLMMACIAPLVYLLLDRGELVPDLAEVVHLRQRIALPGLAGMVGIALGALWEIYEWTAAKVFGVSVLIGYADTIFDLVVDFAGALAGGVLLVVWALKRWPSHTASTPYASRSGRGSRQSLRDQASM